jgi:uncharacterized DUF497 family protein
MAREPNFEWDNAKDRANRAKHGVSFRTAQAAFFDPPHPNFRSGLLAERQTHL